jgi:nitroreductase
MDIDQAIASRRAVRGFLPDPVPRATIHRILELASRAPSGNNTQPWKVYAVAGAVRERIVTAILNAYDTEREAHVGEYRYYSEVWREPYLSRRRALGWSLYGLVGIERGDKAASRRWFANNFRFFGAPVGLIFTLERDLERGSWIDLGMFLENVMLAARGEGLHSCPQAAFQDFHRILRAHLDIPDSEIVVCGMAIGHEDPDAPANRLATGRAPVEEFTRFFGF